MDSALRPRDIQARIRAGETPETVAQVAGTTVERVMPFAAPVLAERAHVAQRAQRSSIRRRPSEGGATPTTARTLGDAVENRLRTLGVEAETVAWDAWRRDDGRWELSADFETGERSGSGTFVFDTPGNYVQLEDDDARWLVGDVLPPAPAPRDDLEEARARRDAIGVAEVEQPLGEDALGLLEADETTPEPAHEAAEQPAAEQADADHDDADHDDAEQPAPGERVSASLADESTVDLSETARRVRGGTESSPPRAEWAAHDEPSDVLFESPAPREAEEPAAEAEETPAPPRPRRRKARGRASVPSWDEIMFGTAQSD